MQPGQQSRSKKNTYRFSLGSSTSTREIFISSNFDSGNIELVKQVSESHYRLSAVPDFDSQSRTKKTWFYFKARAPRYFRLKLVIENVEILAAGYQAERPTAKPAYKVGDQGQWQRLTDCYLSVLDWFRQYREEMEIQIDYTFSNEENVYFALSIPFSYIDCNDYLNQLQEKVRPDVYFNKEVLTYSANQLLVNLLTITYNHQMNESAPGSLNVYQEKLHEHMFPDSNRPIKINKPVVLIICRVHPGETSASHTLVGMLNFICLSDDPRAYLLRRLFLFMVVPMVNPDGVYEGNYRMDSFSTNLNRIYNNPSPEEHPSVFAITKLVEHLNSEQRLAFFFDMHGHSSAKGAFMYGNAFDNIVNQVESQVFCKMLSMNSKYFQYDACNFSERHMKIKDRYEPLTKQGCARVVFGRSSGIIHCLTVESGLHTVEAERLNIAVSPSNPDFELPNLPKLPSTRKPDPNDFLEMNYELGENILITILDVVEKNPYTCISNSEYGNLETLRKQLATQIFQEEERFKMLDLKAYQKTKNIIRHIQQAFTDKIERKWMYYLDDLVGIGWPKGFEGFKSLRKQRLSIPKRQLQQAASKKAVVQPSSSLAGSTTETMPTSDDVATLESSLTNPNPDHRRSLVKSLSPMQREPTPNLLLQEDSRVAKLTLKLQHKGIELMKKSGFQHNHSTRKLLREFRNGKSKQEMMGIVDASGSIKTEPSTATNEQAKAKTNAISSISEEGDILFSLENKEKIQLKLQSRPRNLSNNAVNDIKSRVKTELGNPSSSPLMDQKPIFNPINGKSNSRPGLRQLQPESDMIDTILQKEISIDPSIIDNRMKKLRNSKREIINIKLSQIRKKSEKGNLLRFPEIKRLKYELYNCSRLQQDQLSSYADAVANTVLQIETIKMPASTKTLIKDPRC